MRLTRSSAQLLKAVKTKAEFSLALESLEMPRADAITRDSERRGSMD
jgi:hypothetical protein